MTTRRLALGGLAALAASPALAVNPRRRPEPPPQKPEVLPMRVSRGLPWTSVEVDGGRPLPFLLNLANSRFWCHPSVAEGAGHTVDPAPQSQVVFRQVRVGGRLIETEVPCVVSRSWFEGLPVAGFVGMQRYDPVLYDWDRRELTLNAPPPKGWSEAKVIQGHVNSPVVEVMIDGEPAQMILSTTRAWGMELAAPYVKRRGLWDRYARRRDDAGADGAVLHQSAVIPRVDLAGVIFTDVITRLYAEDTVYRYDQHYADGVIGFDLLRRINLHLDASRRTVRTKKVFLTPNAQREGPQADDRAGIVFKAYGNELQVARLDEAGPGFKAGLRLGDTVIDAEVEGRTEGLAYALTRPAGTEVPLDILRGEKRLRIVVTLADRL